VHDRSAEAAGVPSHLEQEDGAREANEGKRAEQQESTACEPCPRSRGRCDDPVDEGAGPGEHASGAPYQPCGVELVNHVEWPPQPEQVGLAVAISPASVMLTATQAKATRAAQHETTTSTHRAFSLRVESGRPFGLKARHWCRLHPYLLGESYGDSTTT
jgi:hypothetical protein